MSFTKHNFVSGDTLYAAQMNEIETQIESNANKCEVVDQIADALEFTGDTSGYFAAEVKPLDYVKKKGVCSRPGSTYWKWGNLYVYSASSSWAYALYDVTPGVTYLLTGKSHRNSTEYPLAIVYNENGEQVEVVGADSETGYTDYAYTVPEGVAHMAVNSVDVSNYPVTVKQKYNSTGVPAIDRFTNGMIEMERRLGEVEEAVDEAGKVQIGNALTADSYGVGVWDIKNDTLYTSTTRDTLMHAFYTVEPGTYYFATCDCSGNPNQWPGGAFYDADDQVIETFCDTASSQAVDLLIKTPMDCVKILLNRFYRQNTPTLKEGLMAAKDTAVVAQGNSYNLDMAAKLIALEERNPFQMLPLDKGYLSFVFDDCWRDWDSIASLFEQYNCPLCVSVIPDNLGIVCSALQETRGNFTPKMLMSDVIKQVVANGGEVFAHNLEVIGMDVDRFDYEFMYNYYVTTKRSLEANGFTVRGLIGSGGTAHDGSAVARNTREQQLWLVGNYEYGSSGTLPQYRQYTERTTINQSVANIKAVIQDAHANHKWVRFMCHSYTFGNGETFTGEADLIEILEYVQSLGIPVVTYGYMFDRFKSSALEERIKAAEALITASTAS